MPFVSGFLRLRKRPGRPGGPVDPDYGIDEGAGVDNELPGGGELPEVDPPDPPPGLWPPLTPEHPWRPLPSLPDRPSTGLPPTAPPGQPGQPLPRPPRPTDPGWGIEEGPPPGTIWPPLPPGVDGHYWALVAIGGMPGGVQYRYVVVDAGARPKPPIARPPGSGNRPDQGLPPEAEPKR